MLQKHKSVSEEGSSAISEFEASIKMRTDEKNDFLRRQA